MLKHLFLIGTISLSLCINAAAAERKTVFLDRMDGFETYIERAIEKAEMGSMVELVEEVQHPDFKATLSKRFPSSFEAEIFKSKTGRNEDTTLTLIDVDSHKTVITYHFTMRQRDKVKQDAADEFARQLKKVLSKKSQ